MEIVEDKELIIILMLILKVILNYAKGNKSDNERQMPYDFTHAWNLKNISEQTKNSCVRLSGSECTEVPRDMSGAGMVGALNSSCYRMSTP